MMFSDIQESALNYLSRREYARYELQAKLVQKGFNTPDVVTVLDDLIGRDFLSDQRYVLAYITSRARRGFGPIYVRRALQQVQADPGAIELGFEQNEGLWDASMKQIWRRKFGCFPVDYQDYVKQSRFLLQRGYASDRIQMLLKRKEEDEIQ